MNRYLSHSAALLLCVVAILTSCSSGNKWQVNAKIDGAAGKTALLEVSDNGQWHVIDSAKIDGDGEFKFKVERSLYPDIYRLTVDSKSVYFPIDSTETINVSANFANMDVRNTISGSASADMMQKINTALADALENSAPEKIAGDSLLKRELAKIVQADWSGIAAYYLINKTIGDRHIYDPAISFDRGIISAVANAYLSLRPDDPRTHLLEEIATSNRRAYGKGTTMSATVMPFPELELKDFNGNLQKLSDLWSGSKAIVVNFTAYTAENSPAFQLALGEVYNKYHDKGLNIYQVSCDPEEHRWRMAAENIPWTAVYCPSDDASQMLRYNVSAIPTTFVIDGTAEHIERVEDITELDSIVAKYL